MMLYTTAKKVVQQLSEKGFIAYFAGGFVRDFIMKHPSDDIDIVTNAPIETVQAIFPKTIPVGINFGIVIVVLDGHQFEVATFRKDSDYIDGRRPTSVEMATPEIDAKRRDFTINGMFFDPLTQKLYDYVEGQKDIERKLIRAIGDPEKRFLEDRLRMIRAIRYAGRFHFEIELHTANAIRSMAQDLFPSVAIERVWQELKKMALFPHFDKSITLLYKFGLLQVIFPSLKEISEEELATRLKYIPSFPKETPLIGLIYELFPKATLAERLMLTDYLKLSNKDKEFTDQLEMWRKAKQFDDYEWVQLYAKEFASTCLEIVSIHSHDTNYKYDHLRRMEKHYEAITRAKNGKTLVMASDLIKIGIAPGPEMGKLLKKAEQLAVNHHVNDREAILKKLL